MTTRVQARIEYETIAVVAIELPQEVVGRTLYVIEIAREHGVVERVAQLSFLLIGKICLHNLGRRHRIECHYQVKLFFA
jgi:hypothetical protein